MTSSRRRLAAGWYARRMFGNPGTWTNILGVPITVVVLGVAIVGFMVGTAWLWRITRGPGVDDPVARAERYRDLFR